MPGEFVIGSDFCPRLADQRRREPWVWSKPWLWRLQTMIHVDEINALATLAGTGSAAEADVVLSAKRG
jgi:hypothetical protein